MLDELPWLKNKKGQQVLTAMLLAGVILAVSTSAYLWGTEILEKSRDQREFQRMEKLIRDINENIKEIARRGGRYEMEIDLPGDAELEIEDGPLGSLDNVTLSFQTTGRLMAEGRDITIVGTPGTEDPITRDPDVIVGRAEGRDNHYNIEFNLYYKNMTVEGEPDNRIGIDSTGRNSIRGERTTMIIERSEERDINGFTVNVVELRIL